MDQDTLSVTDHETIIFKPTTLISPYTNKPYNDAPLKNENRVSFWCEVCTKPVGGILNGYNHLKGKSHEKIRHKIEEGCIEGSKTKIGEKRRQKEETQSPIKKPKEDVEKLSPSTVISPHTNKPYAEGYVTLETERSKTFWCNICKRSMVGILSTYQHLSGKAHTKLCLNDAPKGKAESKKAESKKVESKKVESKKVESKKVESKKVESKKVESKKVESKKVESKKVESKSKSTVNEDTHTCEDCDLKFTSTVTAITHFKGKRHMKMIAAKGKPTPKGPGEKWTKDQRNGFALSNDLKNVPNENVGSQHQSNQYYSGVSTDVTFGTQPEDQEERRLHEYGWIY